MDKKNFNGTLHLFSLLVLILPISLAFVSCGEDEKQDESDYVSVVPDKVKTFDCFADSDTLIVHCRTSWTASSVPEWMAVTPSSGLDGDTMIVSVSANNTSEERNAVITLSSGEANTSLYYTQNAGISTDYVEMSLESPDVSYSYNEQTGILSATYNNGVVPNIEIGNAFVLPAKYDYDIRVVESVTTSGQTVNVATSQGTIENLFRNISFTLSTNPDSPTRSIDGRRVITPSAYGYLDENGKYCEIYNAEHTRAVYTDSRDLWRFTEDYSGETLYSGKAGTLSWDKCLFDARINATLTFDFGEKKVTGRSLPIGDLKKFSCNFRGNIDIDMLLHYNFNAKYSEKGDEIIKYNVIPTGIVKFTVGPVLVVVLVYTHLGKSHSFVSEGNLDATAGLKLGGEINFGMEWMPGAEVRPTQNASSYFKLYPFTIEAQASAEAKVSYYPQIELGVYKCLGPWFEPRPYLKEHVEAGMRASTDGNNFVGWKAESYSGMDLRMGLKTDFGMFDKEVWKSDVFNVIKDNLFFEAPSRMRLLFPADGTEVKDGQSVMAEFIVESYSPITKEYYPCPLALVNFTQDCGVLSRKVAVANMEGKVSVEWTPKPNSSSFAKTRAAGYTNRKLEAKIVDKNGKTISDATLTVKIEDEKSCPDDNHPHAIDLGLPSGTKWACCNVGACFPEECGGYYAWGETEEKNVYYWKTYKFWNDKNGNGWDDSNEFEDLGDISGTQYDIAHVKWGGDWCMPNTKNAKELLGICTWIWTGEGYNVIGRNGNYIYLPAGGSKGADNEGIAWFTNLGDRGCYWSSTLYDKDTNYANFIDSRSESYSQILGYAQPFGLGLNGSRCHGMTIRPVIR